MSRSKTQAGAVSNQQRRPVQLCSSWPSAEHHEALSQEGASLWGNSCQHHRNELCGSYHGPVRGYQCRELQSQLANLNHHDGPTSHDGKRGSECDDAERPNRHHEEDHFLFEAHNHERQPEQWPQSGRIPGHSRGQRVRDRRRHRFRVRQGDCHSRQLRVDERMHHDYASSTESGDRGRDRGRRAARLARRTPRQTTSRTSNASGAWRAASTIRGVAWWRQRLGSGIIASCTTQASMLNMGKGGPDMERAGQGRPNGTAPTSALWTIFAVLAVLAILAVSAAPAGAVSGVSGFRHQQSRSVGRR